MKALAAIPMLTAGLAQAGEDRTLPVGRYCVSVVSFTLAATESAGDGWVRAYVGESMDHGANAGAHRIWDVRCDDGHLIQSGKADDLRSARELAGALPVGEGELPKLYCVRDPKLPVAAKAICERHTRADKSEGTK